MHIVYASDDNFAEIMGVSIVSLFENNKDLDEIVIYILNSGISEINQKRIQEVFDAYNRNSPVWISATNINEVLEIEVRQDRGSLSQFARLFISSVLPNDLGKVLYLDCDVIIEKPLNDLWDIDLKNKTIAALLDPFSTWYRKNLGLRKDDILFNSGVMLIDFQKWKEEQIEKRILNLIHKYNGLIPQGDQGALNAILSRETELLAPKFNSITMFYDFTYEEMMIYRKSPFYYSKEEIKDAINDPYITHFTTSFLSKRAWVEGSEHPSTSKWLKYKAISPWKDEPLRKYTVKSWKAVYIKLHKALPDELSVRLSGLLQAYGRPFLESIKYKL